MKIEDDHSARRYAKLNILVTGGAGFVGSHLCAALRVKGCNVTILDSTPRRALNVDPNTHTRIIPTGVLFQYVEADLRNRNAVQKALKLTLPDTVIHLAALSLLPVAREKPDLAVSINVDGTRNLLEQLTTTHTVRRFVYLSSSSVYGNFRYRPVDEEHTTNPTENYGRTKLIGEQLTRLYCSARGIEYVVLRPSVVYGPGDHNRRVVRLFLDYAFAGQPLPIDGDGSEYLDFTYVDDLVSGIVLAALADEASNETLNLSRGEERSIRELAETICRLIPGTRIMYSQSNCSRPSRGRLSIRRAGDLLGFRPHFSLERGLADYLRQCNQRLAEAI